MLRPCLAFGRAGAREPAETPAFIALAGWVAICALLSPDPATSMKRAALCGTGRVRGRRSAAVAARARTSGEPARRGRGDHPGASYFGVVFLPTYAIHQAGDFVEPELAGAWRGIFGHKNDASLVFGMLAFVGLYVARAGRLAAGAAIAALSLAFLVFTTRQDRDDALGARYCCCRFFVTSPRDGRLASVAALTPLILLNALGVGSMVFPPLRQLVANLPIDSTFTGRPTSGAFAV